MTKGRKGGRDEMRGRGKWEKTRGWKREGRAGRSAPP